jgi:hypothetical protein
MTAEQKTSNQREGCALQQGRAHSAALKAHTMFERLAMSSSDRTLSTVCRCGKQMNLAAPSLAPERDGTHINVFQCAACGHEMRVTVWGEERR